MEKSLNREFKILDERRQGSTRMLSPIDLAYIGDAVYELCVRSFLIDKGYNVDKMHKTAVKFVSAESQSEIVHNLEEIFTDKEVSIIRKGRNAKSNSIPKNADLIDYKYSTGFEALIGFLYLKGEISRIEEIFNHIINYFAIKEKNYES